MELSATEAQQMALDFLLQDWNIPAEISDWFFIISSRLMGQHWYIVEIGIEGLPDKWYVQVYDTGECDPNYTFTTPIKQTNLHTDLTDLPPIIAEVLSAERNSR